DPYSLVKVGLRDPIQRRSAEYRGLLHVKSVEDQMSSHCANSRSMLKAPAPLISAVKQHQARSVVERMTTWEPASIFLPHINPNSTAIVMIRRTRAWGGILSQHCVV
ncbi:hypothetical protein AVEN_123476-1, partial [Araneus ventricosus]